MYVIIDPAGRVYSRSDEPVPVAEGKGFRLLPEVRPDYDPATQALDPPAEPIAADATEYAWTVRDIPPPSPPALEVVRADAIARVNREAGEMRRQRITDIPGQEATYLRKLDEAQRFVAATAPDPADYPYLSAEAAELTAAGSPATAADVAALVIATASAWTAADARLEGRRRGLTTRIALATTASEIDAVFPIEWGI